MALGKIRLELARSAERGYAFAAPRADAGRLEARGWRAPREACTVHRFRAGEDDAYRHLAPHHGHQWAFRYDDMSEADEPIFRSMVTASRAVIETYSPRTTGCREPFALWGPPGPGDRPPWPSVAPTWGRASVMSIRIILVPLFGSEIDAVALEAGLGMAQRFGARLNGLFVRIDPRDAIPVIGEGVSPAVIEQLTEAAAAEMDRRSQAGRKTFEAACAKSGIAISDATRARGTASAGWVEVTGRRDAVLPRKARVSDLTVLCRPDEHTPPELDSDLEAILFGAGRPLLIVPPGGAPEAIRTVAVAWNDSAEAARAVAGSLPFLEAADAVHALCAKTWRTEADADLDLVQYLEWRGIGCTRHAVSAEDESLGAALLEAASEAGADLLVMGGYGRTRLSELVLGGVTRHVLAHSPLPLLISH